MREHVGGRIFWDAQTGRGTVRAEGRTPGSVSDEGLDADGSMRRREGQRFNRRLEACEGMGREVGHRQETRVKWKAIGSARAATPTSPMSHISFNFHGSALDFF